MDPVIGIDLGITNSCLATYHNGRAEIIKNHLGNLTTPSYIQILSSEVIVGDKAKKDAAKYPKNTFFDVKRLIGIDMQKDKGLIQHLPYTVIEEDGQIQVPSSNGSRFLKPQEVSSEVLKYFKDLAQNYFSKNIKDVVISVPAYFNNNQKDATVEADRIAGFDKIQLVNEPTAAALAYGLLREVENGMILIFDLGGEDFTNELTNRIAAHYQGRVNKELDETEKIELKRCCEEAKRELSFQNQTDFRVAGENFCITKSDFELWCADLFDKISRCIGDEFKDIKVTNKKLERVVLVGGSSRMSRIKSILKDFFPETPLCSDVDVDTVVAIGAATLAATRAGYPNLENVLMEDIIPFSLGIGITKGKYCPMLLKHRKFPCKAEQVFTTTVDGIDNVMIMIYEGDDNKVKNNTLIGEFSLKNIQIAQGGGTTD